MNHISEPPTQPGPDALRPGELAVDLPPPSDAALRFIGRIRTPWASRGETPRQGSQDGPECRVEIFPDFIPALAGLEKFDQIELFYWLDLSRRDLLLQSPKQDGVPRGTFALRSPVRPNPIGLARAKLLRIEAGTLYVRGLDCVDGTPLIDLKPDRCHHGPTSTPD